MFVTLPTAASGSVVVGSKTDIPLAFQTQMQWFQVKIVFQVAVSKRGVWHGTKAEVNEYRF